MSDLTDNDFHPSAERIWFCTRLNNARKWACDRLTEAADFGKKNHLFRWSSFWSWRVCKQTKLSHLSHKKPERIFVHKNWRGGYWQHLVSTGWCYVPHSRSYTQCFVPCFWRSHYQPQSWSRLATSELRFDTTYIHNSPLQPFSQDYWPSFSHDLVVYVNFIH